MVCSRLHDVQPEGLVDINFPDAVVASESIKLKGINPSTFPKFMIHNTGMRSAIQTISITVVLEVITRSIRPDP
jgi:hypothetical protein